ncbi:MAG: recombinase family protein [Lachnospiraceae bacterium]|nr:recombinase family protein [Lachnospiraceae bacterium]
MKKYKVGVYAHCDMAAWEKEKHVSLKRQLRTIHSYLEKNPEFVVVKNYLDESTGNEDGILEDLIHDIDEGLIDCIAVRDISVIGKAYHYGIDFVLKFCPFNEVRVIVVNNKFDSLKENVWNQNRMEYFEKTLNREQIKERLWSLRNTRWLEGKYTNGPVPYGYVRIDGYLFIDPETSRIVRNIYERYLRNDRPYTIAKDLRELGVMSPRAYEYYMRTGEYTDKYAWKECTVWRILKNRFYIGDTVHSQFKLEAQEKPPAQKLSEDKWITVKDTHEPIISREMYDEVQQRFNAIADGTILPNKWIPEFHGSSSNCYKGKIYCGICGRTASYKYKGNWIVYRCVSIGHMAENCGAHPSHIRDINEAVVDILNMRYGLRITEVTTELIEKYIYKISLLAHDMIYVELKEDHIGVKNDGKKEQKRSDP